MVALTRRSRTVCSPISLKLPHPLILIFITMFRLLVHLTLRPSDDDPNLLVISRHEDFYHPEDFAALLVPPLIPLVRGLLRVGTLASNVNARVFSLLGESGQGGRMCSSIAC